MKRSYIFATAFVVLFIAVVVVVVCVTAKNGWKDHKKHPGEPYWKTGVVYQVYPRSFRDADGDGTGDLKGIAEKADYLAGLGVRIIWLSPVFESPMKDFGYDISNYTAIDPTFGTMEDFDNLLYELHRRGLKLVMDFVPNHSSDQHEWFIKSEAGHEKYKDYYVWADGKETPDGRAPPNNWVSAFRGPAWEWSEKRQQYYHHHYLKEQPDLNYRNKDVRKAMENVLRFWLKKGIDGFRLDALKHLYEAEDLSLDEPVNPDSGTTNPLDPHYLEHIYTANLPETFQVLRDWRLLVNEFHDKVLMAEVYADVEDVMKYYGNDTYPLAHFPFNFFLLQKLKNRSLLTGYALKDTISLWLDHMPEGKWASWVLGNHDTRRVASRLGKDLVDALNMVLLLLPGTPVTYYGEEIGMENTFISWEDTKDPKGLRWGEEHYQKRSRDPERTPMQWNDGHMTGFTKGSETWLPVNPNYKEINVAAQIEAEQSTLKVYKELIKLRGEATFYEGELTFPTYNQNTFSFIRSLEGYPSYLVVVNTAKEDQEVDLHHGANFLLPEAATVILRSSTDEGEETKPGSVVHLAALPLLSGEGLVLELHEEQWWLCALLTQSLTPLRGLVYISIISLLHFAVVRRTRRGT